MAETTLSPSFRPSVVSAARPQVPLGAWGLRLAAFSYIAVFVLLPVWVVLYKGFEDGWGVFWESINKPTAYAALKLTVRTALIATLINTVMGTLTAYVLVKYKFPGKKLFNTLIDLPFALPTLVTGVMLVLLYGPQTTVGAWVKAETGHTVLFAPPGIVLALLMVGYPFVIRTIQPVLSQLDSTQEEAAHTLGASAWETFLTVTLPVLRPAVLSGALLSFTRSLGEFGSIIIVAGNIPMRSQTATVYIYGRVESGNMQAASSISLVLLLIAFGTTLLVNLFKGRQHA